jgi:sensor histidine kinase YesM
MHPSKIKKILLTFLRDILFLIVLGNLLGLFIVPRGLWSVRVVQSNCLFSIGIGYPAMIGMRYITLALERKFPWLKYPLKRLVFQVLSLTLFSALIIFIGFSVWLRIIQDIDWRSIIGIVLPGLKVVYSFIFLSLRAGNAVLFFKNWKKATIQQEELKRAHLALQYQSLKDQIRPHFLFNNLSSLVNLINTDTRKATEFVHKLSEVYRYVLELNDTELVPLADELKFLEDYMYLQQIRFGEKLSLRVEAGNGQGRLVIPLSLQMLVENAIKHNEITAEHPLDIHITYEQEGRLVIRNTLRKKQVLEGSTGTGLENLRKRIAFFTVDPLLVREDKDAFTVSLPTFSNEPGP